MKEHLYFLGIGGTLMGSLALLAKEMGFHVSGSDKVLYPPMSDLLKVANIEVFEGFSPEQLEPRPAQVIVGNAGLPRGHEAIEHILNAGLSYVSGAEWLGTTVLRDRWVLAVAGTHGKTTTASMLAWILDYAGLKPGYLIGGAPGNFDQSARLGETPFFVVEADEYDTSYFDRR
ncbi:MAG TPA: UDP-N-acetylmuramate:L-alanyl-gamma-D-glutamyl-meso-diaminopimelate ligase, partial [Gammaproteobacteria bacterium]|nr:UDP-N-acetylmuramate:L-alanyl-gamma-D-glutamyl-meso-diaminopimelate ligase [Gammaproteobacteria bacterium]